MLAAFLLGLIFGVALGPCTFAYMAPMLAVVFNRAAASPVYAASLLLAYGLGHCALIVLAGTFTEVVQRYLDWNERSKGALVVKKICGILVISGGGWLIYSTLHLTPAFRSTTRGFLKPEKRSHDDFEMVETGLKLRRHKCPAMPDGPLSRRARSHVNALGVELSAGRRVPDHSQTSKGRATTAFWSSIMAGSRLHLQQIEHGEALLRRGCAFTLMRHQGPGQGVPGTG